MPRGFAGAALWLPPGVQPQGEAMAELALREMPPDRQDEFAAVGEQMDHHRPSQPHWFLPLMGVDPMRQGSGHGSALLRHALQRCDEEGAIAYLDATSPRNLQLYKRHGFEPQGEIRAGQSPPPEALRSGGLEQREAVAEVLWRTMSGRRLCSEQEAMHRGFGGSDSALRRAVLRETLAAFERADPPDRYHRLAARNLARWRAQGERSPSQLRVEVLPGDWGEVTRALTARYGVCFAVLNMANAYVPGGAYVEGAIAQEENIYRRTDCHFRIGEDDYDADADRYRPHMTRLLSARDGLVYLDARRPRVCIRGPEDRERADLGYPWLPEDQVFPFFELRAAARDLRDGAAFEPDDAKRRIAAQLDTLRGQGVRHAVLGAFGCGAFRNPADRVAEIYREQITARRSDFSVIAFAIFAAGYGPDNYSPFAEAMRGAF